jgi:uncharacterized membrane protein
MWNMKGIVVVVGAIVLIVVGILLVLWGERYQRYYVHTARRHPRLYGSIPELLRPKATSRMILWVRISGLAMVAMGVVLLILVLRA